MVALNDFLFTDERFVGNEVHYEDPRNSFLNEVLDRRTGIPITLALVYMEVARRAGVHVEGINFPGHFLLRCPRRRGSRYSRDLIIDAFHGGALLSEDDCRELLAAARRRRCGVRTRTCSAHATKPQILARMLLNLKRTYVQMHSFPQARDVTELLLAVDPSAHHRAARPRLLAYHLNDFRRRCATCRRYLQLVAAAASVDEEERDEHEQIWEHVKTLRRRVASLN